jgi:hypothetical protein
MYMGHLLKIKCVDSRVNVHILASTSVLYTLTTVQVQNLALNHTKRLTVQAAVEDVKDRARCLGQRMDRSTEPGVWESLKGKGTGPGLQGEKSKDQRRSLVSGTAQGGRYWTVRNAKDSSQRTKDGRLRSTGKRDRTRVPRTKVQGPKNSARC